MAEYLWQKLIAAEADIAGILGVPLAPTEIFTDEPTDAERAALAGKPYLVEPGYDMPPDFFSRNNWGALQLRVRPVIQVHSVRIAYPGLVSQGWDVPNDWLRLDGKYGHLRFFPTAQVVSAPLSAFTMQAMGSGVNIPHMIRVRYRAGIDASKPEFANVLDLVTQGAAIRVLQDANIPASGSVSADGLSQSVSFDVGKAHEELHSRAYTLREKLLGPVWGVL